MESFKVGDIVIRKSYGGDIPFRIIDIITSRDATPEYILKGILYRIQADSKGHDLVKVSQKDAYTYLRRGITRPVRNGPGYRYMGGMLPWFMLRERPGSVLHIDGSSDFLEMCLDYYRKAGLKAYGEAVSENEQPGVVRSLLEKSQADILVITGHDGIKKGSSGNDSMDNYRNSRYFAAAVKEARKYEQSLDKLCIFAGACQSYYEAIMAAGANFASSPGRIQIGVAYVIGSFENYMIL